MLAANRMAKLDYEQRLHGITKRSPSRRTPASSAAAAAFRADHLAAAVPPFGMTAAVYSVAAAVPAAGVLSSSNAAMTLTPDKLKRLAVSALRSSGSSSGSSKRGTRTPGSARRARSRLQRTRNAAAADEQQLGQQRRRRHMQQQQYSASAHGELLCHSDYEEGCEDQYEREADCQQQADSEAAADRGPSPMKDQQPAVAAAAAGAAAAMPGEDSMLATARFWVSGSTLCSVTISLQKWNRRTHLLRLACSVLTLQPKLVASKRLECSAHPHVHAAKRARKLCRARRCNSYCLPRCCC
jgi:hypothetical protein